MSLHNCRILVVEDEYILAEDLKEQLQAAGAVVVGPEPSVERALSRIAQESRIDVAVLDLNLGGASSFPVADALNAQHIPFIFLTGYGDEAISTRYPDAINCNKPWHAHALLSSLEKVQREA